MIDQREDDGTSLGLPVGVDDGALLLSDVLVVPVPSFGVDRLSNGSDSSQRAQVVTFDELFTESTEKSDGGRRGVELRHVKSSVLAPMREMKRQETDLSELVLGDSLPESRGGGVDRSGLEDGRGDSVCEQERISVDSKTREGGEAH